MLIVGGMGIVAYLLTQPQLMAAAAADVAALHTAINEATAAAASGTSDIAAMAGDEVSEAIKTLFNGFAQEGQAVIAQAALFHSEFAQALASAGSAYTNAEAANLSALTAPLRSAAASLLGNNSALNATGNGGALTAMAKAALANSYVTLVMDGSGTSIPSDDFVNNVVGKYLGSTLPAGVVQALALPAGEYPDSGVKDLTSDVSIARGVTILSNAIQQQLAVGQQRERGGLFAECQHRFTGNAAAGPSGHTQLTADKLCAPWQFDES